MKVSIITVCYNSGGVINTAIRSVLSQSYEGIQYIVIDGGSKDNTLSVIHSYGNDFFKVLSAPDKGIYDAMNKGLSLATGDVIGILNSDDFYPHNDVINQVVKTFKAYPDTQMILGNVDFVHPDNLTLPVRFYSSLNFAPWKMRFGFMPAHPAAFIKRSAYNEVGKYKLGYKIGADFEWFVRALMVKRLPYVKHNQTLVRMREGGVSTSGLKSYWLSSKEQLCALRVNGVYSNLIFVLIRLPIKFFHKIFRKGK
ncbi:glycosyltransferase family 2 protein [Methylophaga sp.]|uniref:glycosyltransferase family 2 protein n=1 Tax=Methylophaga sp. TaxID=2024840 RepID=UPI003A902570